MVNLVFTARIPFSKQPLVSVIGFDTIERAKAHYAGLNAEWIASHKSVTIEDDEENTIETLWDKRK